MSNQQAKYNTIFMGPYTHRETRMDENSRVNRNFRWSEEAENEYLESVKKRASEKVRALLLQAKRRSDEIVAEAEQRASEITANAEQNARNIEQQAQNTLNQAQLEYNAVYNQAMEKAQGELGQILMQNQQVLGESTAVVLLSIQEQLGKLYDIWKEDLKQLTLDAIEVGTGWIATTEKERILKELLDESVHKLLDKKNFIVRVNPADAELITQVLENSREKGWSMESVKDLEAGSLELESDNVFVKNSRAERQKFVQEILDNLVLPQNQDEEKLVENVKNTLNHELQDNAILAFAVDPNHPAPDNGIDLEKIMTGNNTDTVMEQDSLAPAMETMGADEEFTENNNAVPMDFQENQQENFQDDLFEAMQSQEEQNFTDNTSNALETEQDIFEQFSEQTQEPNAIQPEPIQNGQLQNENPHAQSAENTIRNEADDMVEDFLGTPKNPDNALPQNIADDLLAELGFGD